MHQLLLLFCLLFASTICAETLFPAAEGTTWKYQMTQEFGRGIKPNDPSVAVDPDGKIRLPITVTVAGSDKIDNVDVRKFELRRQNKVQTIQFLQINEQGVFELARGDESGERIKLNPPQKILSFPLAAGDKWKYSGAGADEKVEEVYEVVAKESIDLPAGKFDAYHLHIVGTQPFNSVVDRWYVANIGEVKDITEVRRPDGSMIQRLSFELMEPPKLAELAEIKATVPSSSKTLSAILAANETGEMTATFTPDTAKVYARWQGHGLRDQAKLRAVWIAEDVGEVAPPNYKVDEASLVAPSPDSRGIFTLSRPNAGWPAGNYRLELYVDETLAETIKFKIEK